MNIAADGTAVRVLLVTVVAALLAVRVRCGVQDGYYGGGGGVRFAKLDKFMHDRMGLAGDRSGETTTVVGRTTGGLLSRTTTTAASIAASPADDDDDDDDGGGGDIDEDIDDDDDDDDDDDGDDDDDDDDDGRKTVRRRQPIRLRHSGRRKQNDLYDQYIQNQEPARTMSPVSENKWKHLGSRVAVDKTFRNVYNKGTVHIPSQGDKESGEVYKHQVRMAKEALCKVPRSRVIKVIDHYPSSNKKYVPSCTVLHVCSDDTGCCGSPTLKCGPKIAQPVMLHFLVYTAPELSDRQSPNQSHQSYQTLRFYNHTECHCQPKDDDSMPKDSSITPTSVDPVDMRDFDDDNSGRYTNSMDVPKKSTSLLDNCKCPTEYTVRYLANGSCSCDCFDKQHECIRYKKGNIYFNFFDRYCITSGQCLSPMCEYGLYSHRTGRCPKKFETLYSFKKKYYF